MRNVLNMVLIFFVVSLTGCESENDKAVSLAKNNAQTYLKDAESARFGKISIETQDYTNRIIICGHIDGKNSYGAYNGWLRFVSLISSEGELSLINTWIEPENDNTKMPDFLSLYWEPYCQSKHERTIYQE